ncbi:hypothetical protein Pan1_19 [Pseudanabaena phage Pan1]|nr:hypothetical protein Pan1_19 [Pseudanabaena phage Pan1]
MQTFFQEDADYEFNAQFDYVREAYGATELDNSREAYYDYLTECDAYGEEPLEFDAWKAATSMPRAAPSMKTWADDVEIPF